MSVLFFLSRIMVGLPTSESRELILRTLLSKEKVDQLDFKELATMTEGYSGSDLKVSSILILVLILPSQGN
jgi:ATP-dependent Zn protease